MYCQFYLSDLNKEAVISCFCWDGELGECTSGLTKRC